MSTRFLVMRIHETRSVCSPSRWERGGVRGYGLSMDLSPLTPTLSPKGRGSGVPARHESMLAQGVAA